MSTMASDIMIHVSACLATPGAMALASATVVTMAVVQAAHAPECMLVQTSNTLPDQEVCSRQGLPTAMITVMHIGMHVLAKPVTLGAMVSVSAPMLARPTFSCLIAIITKESTDPAPVKEVVVTETAVRYILPAIVKPATVGNNPTSQEPFPVTPV